MNAPRLARTLTLTICVLGPTLAACTREQPIVPYTTAVPPMIMTPAVHAGVEDQRTRFREIFCTINERSGTQLPDHRPCEEALVRVGTEAPATADPVYLGRARTDLIWVAIPGFGGECFSRWVDAPHTEISHVRSLGYDVRMLQVSAFSSCTRNARQIRDAVMALPELEDGRRLVLFGYSKGVPDILEAIVSFPDLTAHVAAVVSMAGAVGGSPQAYDPPEWILNLIQRSGGERCDAGDGGGLASLEPATRRTWLARHPLPESVRYFSLVTYPDHEHISRALQGSYDRLSQIDPRNDSQLLFYDQIIPGGILLGFVNADHLAIALPIDRSLRLLSSILLDQIRYPREVLAEAVFRHVEEQILASESDR